MGSHLKKVHQFTEEDWANEKAKGMQKGLNSYLAAGKIILSKEELEEQQCGLGFALANSLLPISIFEAKEPRNLHFGDEDVEVDWTSVHGSSICFHNSRKALVTLSKRG